MAENSLSQAVSFINDNSTMEVGLTAEGQPAVRSDIVAYHFKRSHKNVLRDIAKLRANCPESFYRLNFEPIEIDTLLPHSGGIRKDRAFLLTRDAFSLLVMGFTGAEAVRWKIRYIEAFNTLEAAALESRAELARLICEAPERAVVDEFTSVVDRQIAKIGATAFAKAWRRTGGQVVLLSCHYDIIDWLAPDWIFDTGGDGFRWTRGCLQRPRFELEIRQTGWEWWPYFEPHHYLKLPHMIAATNYVGFVDGQPVAHVAVSTRQGFVEARACRLVVMPEWQGAGVGMRFLNTICQMWRDGQNRYGKPMPTLFHTSHPGMCAALRRSPLWTQVSARLYGENKARSARSIARSREKSGAQGSLGGLMGMAAIFGPCRGSGISEGPHACRDFRAKVAGR